VPEVEGGQIEEVDNEDQLSPNIVTTNEQHDEGKEQEVADDEVASYTGGSVDIVGIGGEEGPDISDLKNEENNPVNGGDDGVLSERSVIQLVDSPDCMAGFLLIIPWYIERIVEGSDEEKEPGESTEELVSPNGLDCMRLASCKRVQVASSHFGGLILSC